MEYWGIRLVRGLLGTKQREGVEETKGGEGYSTEKCGYLNFLY